MTPLTHRFKLKPDVISTKVAGFLKDYPKEGSLLSAICELYSMDDDVNGNMVNVDSVKEAAKTLIEVDPQDPLGTPVFMFYVPSFKPLMTGYACLGSAQLNDDDTNDTGGDTEDKDNQETAMELIDKALEMNERCLPAVLAKVKVIISV